MTECKLYWLGRRHRQQRRSEEERFAVLLSMIANYSMRAPKEPFKPQDFMPSKQAARRQSRRKSRDEIANEIRGFFGPLVEGD